VTFGALCDELCLTDLERELAWAFVEVMRREIKDPFWKPGKYLSRAGTKPRKPKPRNFPSLLSEKMWRAARKVKA
jgi:hypothetical protein